MRKAAVAIAILCSTASGLFVGCSKAKPSATPAPPATSAVNSTVSVTVTPTRDAAPQPVTDDADAHGFTVFGVGARCWASDEAQMFMRTDKSALVVCRSEINRLYYRGYRISDGASIELQDVSRQDMGFVAINAANTARYVITADGFQLIENGTVVDSESAVESGPPGWAASSAPAPAVTSPIVLGSASAMGPASLGYGYEQPQVISMGSCPNAISNIVWQDWGSPEAHGSGLGCVQYGQPPQYPLVASNIGVCRGVLAYRTLQISTNPPQDICSG